MLRRRSKLNGRAGFTLVELITAIGILGILVGIAAPSFDGILFRLRSRAILDRVAGDLYHARMLAVRDGRRTAIRFYRRPDRRECHASQYTIVVRGPPERIVKRVELETPGDALCLQFGRADSVVFNSRGLPASINNRKMYVRRGDDADSLTLSMLGRVIRWY